MSASPFPVDHPSDRRLATSIFGYDVVQWIGEGAGSTIYAVSHPHTRQILALKHVLRKSPYDDRFIVQLENEFNIGQRIEHPNLRRSVDLKMRRTMLHKVIDAALVMDLVEGQSLDRVTTLTMPKLAACLLQVARGLQHLHGLGFVHCDLKPNNILLAENGNTKVIDLGQACPIGMIKERIQGTPDYISPEQVKREAVSARTDVYSFGATLYWALCGKKVPTLMTLQKSDNSFLVADTLAAPHEINASAPETLSLLAMDCIRLDPARRADVAEIIRRLEAIEFVLRRSHKPADA